VILWGKAGTLAELSFLWALHRAGCLERRPVVLLGEHWRGVMDHLQGSGLLDEAQIAVTRMASDPREVLEILAGAKPEKGS
jgi:predicted Rossmann-fold nucleotide-binding protein